MTIADIIGTQADESTAALLAQGWEGGGASYDLGTYSGDEEALEEKLGRWLTDDECASLEHQIRRRLDAAIKAPVAITAERRAAIEAGDVDAEGL